MVESECKACGYSCGGGFLRAENHNKRHYLVLFLRALPERSNNVNHLTAR